MKIVVILSETKPGEVIKLSQLVAAADVVVENGVVIKQGKDR